MPFGNDPWFRLVLLGACIICSWLFSKYILSNKYVSYTAFGNNILIITRTRILSICGLFLVTVLDYIHTILNTNYKPLWAINIIIAIGFAAILIISFSKKISKKTLSNLITAIYFVVLFTYLYRCFEFSFELSLITQIVCVLIFSVYIFQNTKSILYLYLLIVIFFIIFISLTNASKNDLLFSAFALFQTFIALFFYFVLENKKLAKISFSDKILNSSELFIFVANIRGEIIFVNEYLSKRTGFKIKELLQIGWWQRRGWTDAQIHEAKINITKGIKEGSLTSLSDTFFNSTTNETIYIDWQLSSIEEKFMLFVGKDVTEETKQKEELIKIDERYKTILNNVGEIIYTTDIHGNFLFINNRITSMLGYLPSELLGKHFTELVHEDDKATVELYYLKQYTEKNNNTYFQFKVLTKQKKTVWVAQTLNFIFDDIGEIIGFQSVIRDITQAKQQEFDKISKLEKQQLYNATLTKLSVKNIEEYHSINEFYYSICENVAKTIGINRVSIWFVEVDAITCNILYTPESIHPSENIILNKIDYPIYINEINKGFVVTAPDVTKSPVLQEFISNYFNEYHIKSLLDIPIRSNGKLIGIICCENTHTIKNWTEQDEIFLKSIADLISVNIESNKRKQAEKIIKESEANFRLLNETIDDVFWLYDLKNSKVLYISPSCLKVLGVSTTDFYNSDNYWKNYVFEDDKHLITEAHKKIEIDGYYELEYRIHSNEGVKWISEKSFGIKEGDETYTKSSGICSDITSKKNAQQTITQLSLVAQKAQNIITISNADDYLEWANDAFVELTGYQLEEIKGIHLLGILQGELSNKDTIKRIEDAIKNKISIKEEIINYKKNGEYYWIELNINPVFDEKNNLINYISVGQDITERKAKENLIETQNFDILSSINYAKRIQNALLPDNAYIATLPINLELYYKPKDIIGGDFYWVDCIENKIVIAVGDCTGHGVPGALMTSLGINGLINSVSEQSITKPSEILTYLDNYIYNILKSSDVNEKINDGMDIGIVTIDLNSNSLEYSGASRPLYYFNNDEMLKIDGSRKSIGSKAFNTEFETTMISNISNYNFYLFSDGMTDQFGGDKAKRLGTKNFIELLQKIQKQDLKKQKEDVYTFFKTWAKEKSQTDDMIWLAFNTK